MNAFTDAPNYTAETANQTDAYSWDLLGVNDEFARNLLNNFGISNKLIKLLRIGAESSWDGNITFSCAVLPSIQDGYNLIDDTVTIGHGSMLTKEQFAAFGEWCSRVSDRARKISKAYAKATADIAEDKSKKESKKKSKKKH